jgi:type IV secretory pathway TrbD component
MSYQAYLDAVEAKTGKSMEVLVALARDRGFADAGGLAAGVKATQITDWLKADFGLGHGHAMAMVAYLKGKRD